MAPTEAEVLTNYLIRPASLDAILTYDAFAERFPPSQRDSPQVRALWRDLVARRELVLDEVRASIDQEVRRGQAMRWEVLRARREAEREEPDGEVEVERTLFGEMSGAKPAKHSLDTVVPELDGAASALEAEIDRLRDEEETLLASVRQTVGGLSDLRYGKFANGQITNEVLDGLATLRDACDSKR